MLLSSFLLSVTLGLIPQEAGDRPKTHLEQQFEARTGELKIAEDDLEQTYLRMEKNYSLICGSPDEIAGEIAHALATEADALRTRLEPAGTGKGPGRSARLVLAKEAVGLALEMTAMDSGFHQYLENSLSELVLMTVDSPTSTETLPRVKMATAEIFVPGRDFAAVWNDLLFTTVEEARQYNRAYSAYIDAGRKVELERSPERFDEGGERLPPGMVLVKGDNYVIGPHSGWERKGIGKRGKRVNLKTFYLDRNEVTNEEYAAFMRSLSPTTQVDRAPKFWSSKEDGSFSFPDGRQEHPVVGVNFNDAMAYASWAGKRLPTEEEWEAAARGTEGVRYPWGDEYIPGACNDREARLEDSAPVSSFPEGRSRCGCNDLGGNIEEWTASTKDGSEISEPLESNLTQVVIRGGNFSSNSDGVATTFRWVSPGLSTRRQNLGFRCAMTPGRGK